MNWLQRILSRRQLFEELSEEIRQHLDEKVDALIEAGMAREEAEVAARREFGNTRAIEERAREVWQWPALENVLFDVRYAIRQLRRQPTFAVVAVLVLALGIGANTAAYSLIDNLLLEPLPFRDAERLTWIINRDEPGLSNRTSTVATFEALERMSSFEDITAYNAFFDRNSYKISGDGEPDRVVGVMVPADFFPFLGIQPALGRVFTESETQLNGPGAVLLSHKLWVRRYSSDPDVIGRTLTINDRGATVVGVLPPEFDFGPVFAPATDVEIYVPLIRDLVRNWGNTLQILGRLEPGVSNSAAQAEADTIIARQKQEHPELGDYYGAIVRPMQETVTGSARRPALILGAAVGLVLLIACVNLSNLLLARTASRQKEIALRSALGAGRGRLARQLLIESLVLSAIGGTLGIVLAKIAIVVLKLQQGLEIPLLNTVGIDGTVLIAALLLSIATAMLFGTAPALGIGKCSPGAVLKTDMRAASESRDQRTLRSHLVVSQIVLACALLVSAGLLLRSFLNLLDVELGFRADQTWILRVDAGEDIDTSEEFFIYVQKIMAAAGEVEAIDAVSVTDAVPFGSNRTIGVRAEGQALEENIGALLKVVGSGLFRTMRTPIVAGRDFTVGDNADSPPVAIVNESLANRLWPEQDPLRKQLMTFRGPRQVVGVVADVHHLSVEQSSGPEFYVPITQSVTDSPSLVIRTRRPFADVAPQLRRALRQVVPNLPASSFVPLQQFVDRAVSSRRFFVSLLVAFASSALLLAGIGIYGVVSYTVTQRTPEIGVRMALGATRSRIRAAVVRDTMRLTIRGVALGILVATVFSALLSSLLFEISPIDPGTYLLSAAVLIVVATGAGLIPATRATRIAPMTTLKAD